MLETSSESLREYYAHGYRDRHGPRLGVRSDYEDIFTSYVNYQDARVELLRKYLNREVRLLEVGCSTGHFLYNVRGLVGEVVGIDYDSEAAAFAARKCGCTTYSGELSESGLPEHSFDVICAMQVMEHVVDPIAFARMLAKYLAPGGIVYVEVPNLADPLLSLYAEPSYRPFYFHEAHVFYMSARALATIMLRAGFSGELHFLQEYNFLNHLHWVTRHGPQPSCHPGLQAPTVPTSEMLPEETRRQFEGWLKRTDREYKAFLVDHGLTDNVAFIGHIEQ